MSTQTTRRGRSRTRTGGTRTRRIGTLCIGALRIGTRRPRIATVATVAAVAAALLPLGGGAAQAASAGQAAQVAPAAPAAPAAQAGARELPEGVVILADGPCPMGMLCLYRDIRRGFPAYAIRGGYDVDLRRLPMKGFKSDTAADNVSSWVNNTGTRAGLVDDDARSVRKLNPHSALEETVRGPNVTNDTVDRITW